MLEFLNWLEASGLSVWVRESTYGFQLSLSLHALGMAFLVGVSFLIDLRILGVAINVPMAPLKNFLPLLWGGFFVALLSGLLLLIAYPAKGLTNPVFYTKLLLVAAGLVVTQQLARKTLRDDLVISPKHKLVALISMLLWISVITLGRLLAYTYKVLMSLELGF